MDVNVISAEKGYKWTEYIKDELLLKTFGLINVKSSVISSIECLKPFLHKTKFTIFVLDQIFLDILNKVDWQNYKENCIFVCLGLVISKILKEENGTFNYKDEDNSELIFVIQDDVSNVSTVIENIRLILLRRNRIYENLVIFPNVATLTDELGICLPIANNRQTLRLQFMTVSNMLENQDASIHELSASRTNSAHTFQVSKEDLNEVMEHVGCGEILVRALLSNCSCIKSDFKLISLEMAAKRLEINNMKIGQVIDNVKKWNNDEDKNSSIKSGEHMLLGNFMDERMACCAQLLKSSSSIKAVSQEGSLLHFATKYNLKRTVHALLTNPKTVDLMLLRNDDGQLPLDMSEDSEICDNFKKFCANHKFLKQSESIYTTMANEKIEDDEYLIPQNLKSKEIINKCGNDHALNSDLFSAQLIDIESRLKEQIICSTEGQDQTLRWLRHIRLDDHAETILDVNKSTLFNIYSMLNKTQRELPKLPCERPVPEKRRNKSQPELMINPTILKTFRKKETKDDWKIPPSVPPRINKKAGQLQPYKTLT